MAQVSRWCKDGRRRFLGSFVNELQPGGPGALGQITKKNSCRATVPGPRLLDGNPGLQCSGGRALVFLSAGGEALKIKKTPLEYRPKQAGCFVRTAGAWECNFQAR